MDSAITIGYWSIRGLAAPLRMMVLYSGRQLRDVQYDLKPKPEGGWDASCWFSVKPGLKEKNPLINLPYVEDNGRIVSQSNACFLYLGRRLGMLGSNEDELIACEQLLCEIMDLRNDVVEASYNSHGTKETYEALLHKFTSGTGILQKIELWLGREVSGGRSGTFLVGDKASAPDFHLWEMLDQLHLMAHFFHLADPLTDFPHLAKFKSSFAALSANAKYFSTKLPGLPCNQKMASFGALPCGGKWEAGKSYDWGDLSALYE